MILFINTHNVKYSLSKKNRFFTQRKSKLRNLNKTKQKIIDV